MTSCAGNSSDRATRSPEFVAPEREPQPDRIEVPKAVLSGVVRELNRFSIELYKNLDKEGNTIVSPLSVAASLGVLELGAKGEAALALHRVLGVSDPETYRLGLRGLL
jgi:serine protease inhibitor